MQHEQYVANFFEDDKTIGKKENILMGNLSSYYFWQCIFKVVSTSLAHTFVLCFDFVKPFMICFKCLV